MLLPEEKTKLERNRMNNLTNADFMNTIFSIGEKYQLFSDDDIEFLTSSEKCHDTFTASSKSILLDITDFDENSISGMIRDNYENGKSYTRYYRKPEYHLNGRMYLASNDMYGRYKDGEKRVSDNRTPLYEWFMEKCISKLEDQPLSSMDEDADFIYPQNAHEIGVFDSWTIIDENTAKKYVDNTSIANNSSRIPQKIRWFFDVESLKRGESKKISMILFDCEYQGRIDRESDMNGRTTIRWDAKLGKRIAEYQGKENLSLIFSKTENGAYKLNFDYEGKEFEKMVLSCKDTIKMMCDYVSAKGFDYEPDMIENFYLSLKSKPFVILAGTSGTGKTRLVRLFAEAIGATAENGRYKLVSVRPDWSDSSDLFGHTNLKGDFVPGAIFDFIVKASSDKNKPYFLCLDEMNLARVEYYLSDFLSIIETRHKTENSIETDEIFLGEAVRKVFGPIILPENLYVIGTVNMDETTFPFSKKVLDRANTIEFSEVDLNVDFFDEEEQDVESLNVGNDFLKTEYLILKTDTPKDERDFVKSVCVTLQDINETLKDANAHVGYRVRDEIVFYMLNNKIAGLLDEDAAMDNEIMQKILPRIQGSSNSVKEMLCKLFKKCAGDYTGLSQTSIYEQMEEYIKSKDCKYKKSAMKISYMMRRYEEDGFTSYWL